MSRTASALLIFFSIPLIAQTSMTKGFDKLLYINDNDTLPYQFLQPLNGDGQEKFPLLIFLHGAGERGHDNSVQTKHIEALLLNADNRKKFPCFVLAPQCPAGTMWALHDGHRSRLMMRENPTRPMLSLIELLAKVEEEYPIDPDRIYLVGLSMGGFGTWDLLARFPDRFAAAVPICGGGDPETAASFSTVPIWVFHGARDRVVEPKHSRIMVDALLDAGSVPRYTEYKDVGHNSWDHAFRDPELLPWIFQQRKKQQD